MLTVSLIYWLDTFFNCFLFSEKIEVPVLKKRREVLPVDISAPNSICTTSAVGEEVYRLSPQKEEAQSYSNSLEDNNLQLEKTVSISTSGVILSPYKNLPVDIQPRREKKCVKLTGVPDDSEALSEGGGSTHNPARSVWSFLQGGEQPSPPRLYRCMNCAVCFLIYFLSIACSVITQFHLPTFQFSKTLRKTKMIARGKDWKRELF